MAQRVEVGLGGDGVLVVARAGRRRRRAARRARSPRSAGLRSTQSGLSAAAGRAAAGGSSRSPWRGSRAAARALGRRTRRRPAVEGGGAARLEREDRAALDRVEVGCVERQRVGRVVAAAVDVDPQHRGRLARDAATGRMPTIRVPPSMVTRRVGRQPVGARRQRLEEGDAQDRVVGRSTSTKSMPLSRAVGVASSAARRSSMRTPGGGVASLIQPRPANRSSAAAAVARRRPVDDGDASVVLDRLDVDVAAPRSRRRATAAASPGRAPASLRRAPSPPGAKTSAFRPQPKSGRLTRSPGLVNSTCRIMSRTWSSSSVVAVRPAAAEWNGTSRNGGSLIGTSLACTWTWAGTRESCGSADGGEDDLERPGVALEVRDHAARDRGEQAPPVARLVVSSSAGGELVRPVASTRSARARSPPPWMSSMLGVAKTCCPREHGRSSALLHEVLGRDQAGVAGGTAAPAARA